MIFNTQSTAEGHIRAKRQPSDQKGKKTKYDKEQEKENSGSQFRLQHSQSSASSQLPSSLLFTCL